jgi:hypothetical protein
VPGFLDPPPPPPHATRADITKINITSITNSANSFLPDFLMAMVVRASTKSNPSQRAKNRALGRLGENIGKTKDGAVVEIERVEVVEPEPGVGEDGENKQEEREGRPEQTSDTGFVNAPNCEAIDIV